MIICPCGNNQKLFKVWNSHLSKEVRVLSCLCGREKEVVKDDDMRFVTSGAQKFKILAERL